MPMHLVNKMGEPDAPDERFIDVFDGGKLLTRLVAAMQPAPTSRRSKALSLHNTFHPRRQPRFPSEKDSCAWVLAQSSTQPWALLQKKALTAFVNACRNEMQDMMHRLIDSFAAAYLEPMTRSELYRRMCMNLVTVFSPQHLCSIRT